LAKKTTEKKKTAKKKTAKKKMGRPSKCTEEIADELIKFFETSETFPFFGQFEIENDLSIGKCARWVAETNKDGSEKYPYFCIAYKKAKLLQEKHLVDNALNGNYNSTFAIFTAKNILRWRDKHEIANSGGININIKSFAQPGDGE
jgi:hypothetical protein